MGATLSVPMSYLVLARKYRPRTFQEVAGQKVVTDVLRGAIEDDRIGHAYLFCGPRGTGKTTTARILAKGLNCEQGPTADPCGTCERCTGADEGSEVDIVEIDAASHTGVDNIRELRDQAAYAPMRSRYKVFIVDEVHMLSKGAFNALLKTLEEPPPHVKFLFATTEPQRLPDTIVSRCQVMRLAPIKESDIVARLTEVAAAEGLTPGEGVLAEIARRARGGMRDALSLLDQLLALVGVAPTLEDLDKLGGEGGIDLIDELLAAAEEGRKADCLQALPEREGGEGELVGGMLEHLRQCLLAALCGPKTPLLSGSESARTAAVERGGRLGADRLELWLAELLHARERMRLVPEHARLVLETTLLELARGDADVPLAELEQRLVALEARLGDPGGWAPAPRPTPASSERAPRRAARRESGPKAEDPAPAPAEEPEPPRPRAATTEVAPEPEAAPEPERSPEPVAEVPRPAPAESRRAPRSNQEAWTLFLAALEQDRQEGLAEALRRCGRLQELGETRAWIVLEGTRGADRELFADSRTNGVCARAFSAVVGRELSVTLDDTRESAPADEFTQTVADLFDGRVDDRRG